MKFYSIPKKDGGVAIMQTDADPYKEVLRWPHEQIDQVDAGGIAEIDPNSIPQDRTFRSAWKVDLTVDMTKARDIHRDNLRKLRAPILESLDIEMTRAFNDPAKQATIEAERQALRDVTADPSIDAAKTPEQLKAAIPTVLK